MPAFVAIPPFRIRIRIEKEIALHRPGGKQVGDPLHRIRMHRQEIRNRRMMLQPAFE